jgi:hypothetical protein
MAQKVWKAGDTVFVRGPKDNWVGTLVEILPFRVCLKNCSWVADTGRLGEFVRTGRAEGMETEFMGDSLWEVRYDDIGEWPHKLFTEDS